MKPVKIKDFSKDHWSLFGYIESRIHSHQVAPGVGELNKDNLRINENGDYGILATPFRGLPGLMDRSWQPAHGTRLAGYWNKKGIDQNKILHEHDDVNCIQDLETAGLLEVVSLVNFYVKFTEKGKKVASELRNWKNEGKMYANFKPSYIK